ncbi:MAG TPA: M23 family metallopeptidase [Prolixibacteraceae bacterium]|jgi:LysM repeat protein
MKLRTLLLTAGLLFSISSFSQPTVTDTIHAHCETSESDTLSNSIEDLPSDSLRSNDESFYHNIWNSTQIKYPLNTLPPNDVTITITLAEPYDHPFVQPVRGKVISKFGPRGRRMHTGTDIKLNSGDTVRCAFDGKVRLAKRFNGYGNLVLVRHSNGLETIYGHLKAIKVNVNDTIKAGDLIGLGGRTGRATCDHLHFETRLFGEPFDSNKFIDFENCALRSNHVYYKNKQLEIDPANFNRKPVSGNHPALAEKAIVKENIATAENNSPPNKVNTASKGSVKAKATKHVIRKGDNLGIIARKYNTSVKKLCTVNNITAQKTLKVGSVLRIN